MAVTSKTAGKFVNAHLASDNVVSAVKALKSVFNDVNSSRTASKNKLAKLWSNIQDYAGKLPKCLPAVKAIDLMPATVNVPCISKSVTIHS